MPKQMENFTDVTFFKIEIEILNLSNMAVNVGSKKICWEFFLICIWKMVINFIRWKIPYGL